MESTTGGRDTVARCVICKIPIDLETSHYVWSSLPGITIERELCDECGTSFQVKTNSLFDWAKAQAHTKFIEWENSLRLEKDLNRRQLKMPGV